MERRFTVVLHADIAGYARLMDLDEERTHRRLRQLRKSLWDPVIRRHGGRIANTTGDSLLVEFEAAKVGLECAIEVQIGMQSRNRDLGPDRYIALRIGVHHGRVFSERGDLFGNDVIVATRLQEMAAPGGIMISRSLWEATDGYLREIFVDAGEHRLKNIARPLQLFAWRPCDTTVDSRAPTRRSRAGELLLDGVAPGGRLYRLRIRPDMLRRPEGIVIGRQSATCDLVVAHPSVSRQHARLTADGMMALIEDLDSTNGTSVAGVGLAKGRPVPCCPVIR
jgi:class 3 adenylate cyclase